MSDKDTMMNVEVGYASINNPNLNGDTAYHMQEKMEARMFSAMMKYGSYKIDYLNRSQMGNNQAIGLYVLGDILAEQPYSRNAKHALFTGLLLLREQVGINRIVAVYLDINTADNPGRPAYQQMKNDMKAGMFRKVFVESPLQLTGSDENNMDWWNFYRELPSCEIWTAVDGEVQIHDSSWHKNDIPHSQRSAEVNLTWQF